MKRLTVSMSVSLDGFVVGPDGGFDWAPPDEEEFGAYLDEIRGVDVHLLGRRLYETMSYWEDPDQTDSWDAAEREWAERWKQLPKVVFSRTLTSVTGTNTRLATVGVAEEVARLRDEPGDGEIAVGGAELAASVAEHDLVDEYRLRICPVLVGGGRPFFPRGERQVGLELLSTRTFSTGAVALRYGVRR